MGFPCVWCATTSTTPSPTPNVTSSATSSSSSIWFYLSIGFLVGVTVLGGAFGAYRLYRRYWPAESDDDGSEDDDGDDDDDGDERTKKQKGDRDGKGGGGDDKSKKTSTLTKPVKSTAFSNSPLAVKSSTISSGGASAKDRAGMSWPPPPTPSPTVNPSSPSIRSSATGSSTTTSGEVPANNKSPTPTAAKRDIIKSPTAKKK